jgi:hypothetical protein
MYITFFYYYYYSYYLLKRIDDLHKIKMAYVYNDYAYMHTFTYFNTISFLSCLPGLFRIFFILIYFVKIIYMVAYILI